MTMDITTQQRSEITASHHQTVNHNNNNSNNNKNNDFILTSSTLSPTNLKSTTSLKRSFDVAFLMMPDEKLRQRTSYYQNMEKHLKIEETIDVESYPKDLSPNHNQAYIMMQNNLNGNDTNFFNNNNHNNNNNNNNINDIRKLKKIPTITNTPSPRIYDDPTIIPEIENTKSAFTKVHSQRNSESPIPTPSISPSQLSCPSISPPISTTPPIRLCNSTNQQLSSSISGSPLTSNSNLYQNFRPEYHFNGAFQTVGQAHALATIQNNRLKQHLLYRPITPNNSPDMLSNSNYLPSGGFPFANHSNTNPFVSQPTDIIRHPAAAAVLTALIPPTLASTFSLTSQNVCAKCNISFRMTSDLVYHMRSHHKSESTIDPNRRKRQEKLKCPVCCESFRERHHLTRHMTAHQDKESDESDIHSGGKTHDKK